MTIYLNTDFGIPGQFCKTKNLLVVRSVISNSRDHFDKMGDLTTNLELGKLIDTGTMASNAYNELGIRTPHQQPSNSSNPLTQVPWRHRPTTTSRSSRIYRQSLASRYGKCHRFKDPSWSIAIAPPALDNNYLTCSS